jgi:hypothetical protein
VATWPDDVISAGDSPPVGGESQPLRVASVLALAAVLGVALSLQYVAQPFIWRHWPPEEIFHGWLHVVRHCLVNALVLALAIYAAAEVPTRRVAVRIALLGLAAFGGAAAGEGLANWLDGAQNSAAGLLAHATRWSVVALAVVAVHALWRRERAQREALRFESLRRAELEEQLIRARVGALQSQIEPHFLFNTLGTIRRLQRVDPSPGGRLLAGFLDYLERTLAMNGRITVTLGDEIDLVRAYLAVLEARMRERLRVEIDVNDALRELPILPWGVATLVENAVKHGIAPLERGGLIRIAARRVGDCLEVSVSDDGAGLTQGGGGGGGLGLSNVRARLAALHGSRARLLVESRPVGGVRAVLRMPVDAPP